MGSIATKLPENDNPAQSRSWTNGFFTPGLAEQIRSHAEQLPHLSEAIDRAVDTTAIAASGKRPPWVFDQFVNTAAASSRHLGLATVVGADGNSAQLSRLITTQDQLQAGVENTNVTDSTGLTFGGTAITLTEVYWYERLTLNYLEDNIAGDQPEQSVGAAVLAGFVEQLSKLALEGDVAEAGFLGVIDGWVQHATDLSATSFPAADVEFTNATTINLFLDKLWDNLAAPYRFQDDIVNLVHGDTLKRLEVEARTAAGGKQPDTAFVSPGVIRRGWHGERVIGEDRRHTDADEKWRVMCTTARNLCMAVGRDMRVDAKFLPRLRAVDYVVSSRIGFGVRDPAAVKMGIPPAAIYGPNVVADGP